MTAWTLGAVLAARVRREDAAAAALGVAAAALRDAGRRAAALAVAVDAAGRGPTPSLARDLAAASARAAALRARLAEARAQVGAAEAVAAAARRDHLDARRGREVLERARTAWQSRRRRARAAALDRALDDAPRRGQGAG